MPRRRRRRKFGWPARIAIAILAVPLLYVLAALIGGLIPVNADWQEPDEGVTIYLANNGVHVDLVMPANHQGLDWRPLLPKSDMADVPADARWIAFGAGERRVYLETPTLGRPFDQDRGDRADRRRAGDACRMGPRPGLCRARDPPDARGVSPAVGLDPRRLRARPGRQARAHRPSRLRPARRLLPWRRKANAIHTCNQWAASRLRLAGVRAPLWSPFVQGLVCAITDPADQST